MRARWFCVVLFRGPQGFLNLVQDALGFFQHLIIPEPKNAKSAVLQLSSPRVVTFLLTGVLAAVRLHD